MRAKKMHGTDYDAHEGMKETRHMNLNRPYSAPRRSVPVVPVLALVFIILAAMAVLDFKDDSLELQQKQYCNMVAAHKQNPDVGWPDYDDAFEESCNADGSVKDAK